MQQYEDANIEIMKKRVQELELKNAELQQKLEVAQAQLKEWNKYTNSDPFIDKQLRKCHDVFLCLNESGYQKLSDLLADPKSKLTMDVKVHGMEVIKELKQFEKDLHIYIPKGVRVARKEDKKFRRMTTVAKHILLGIIEDIYRLHRLELTLNGKFTLDDFYWTHLKKVKLDPALKFAVCQRERNGMINDFHQIYQIIIEMLSFHDRDLIIPDDLQSLLDLLNSDDPVKHNEIIRYNMSLLSEIGKKNHFITLYDRLQQQIREDNAKGVPEEEKISEKVLRFISNRFINTKIDQEPWSSQANKNSYVGTVYEFRRSNMGTALKDPIDLLIVWRNAISHILESSIEDGEQLFKDEDLVNMLESAIPGVLNELQKAMSEAGLLELPHLIRAMRM